MVLYPQKQRDMGGNQAWCGGNQLIYDCPFDAVLHLFVQRRFQSMMKLGREPDPTQLIHVSFEARLKGIEIIAPDPAICYDHDCFRGLYARYNGDLPPEQAEAVDRWEATKSGQYVLSKVRDTLRTCWREVPIMAFGDSGSCNKFRRTAPSMLEYSARWLDRSMGKAKDYIKGGHDAEDWAEELEKHGNLPPEQLGAYDPQALMAAGYGSIRPDAPELQPAPLVEGPLWEHGGLLAPNNVLILIDAMNSGTFLKSARKGAAGDDFVRRRRLAYERFFQLARQRFHKIIYVKTPPPAFWKIHDQKTLSIFLPMAKYAEEMAMKYGAYIVDGSHHFASLERYRKPDDPWHYSSVEFELCLLWEEMWQDLIQLSQYALPDRLFHHCCQSFPQLPIDCIPVNPTVTDPEISIKPPNAAVISPSSTVVEPEAVAELIDGSNILFIPVDDVKVVLQTTRDSLGEEGNHWIALTCDVVQTLGSIRLDVDVSLEMCEEGSTHAKELINGPRPTSCNTHQRSDRLVTPSMETEAIVTFPQQQKMTRPILDFGIRDKVSCKKESSDDV